MFEINYSQLIQYEVLEKLVTLIRISTPTNKILKKIKNSLEDAYLRMCISMQASYINRKFAHIWIIIKGSEIWPRLGCKWSGFRMESEIRKPNHLKYRQMSTILSKTLEIRTKMTGFRMVDSQSLAIWNRTFKKSGFQMVGFQIPTVLDLNNP